MIATTFLLLALTTAAVFASSSSSSSDSSAAEADCAVLGASDVKVVSSSVERPEDIVVIGGKVYATDNTKGVVIVDAKTGKATAPCNFASVGYKVGVHQSNGIFVEAGEKAVWVTDIYEGFVFRCNLENKLVKVAFKHEHGINDLAIDSHGRIWYTVSSLTNGAAQFFGSFAEAKGEGELWTYDMATQKRTRVASGLFFANGLALNEETSTLFVAESHANRISRFHVNLTNGTVTAGPLTHATVPGVDNLEFAPTGDIVAASVGTNQVFLVSQCPTGKVRLIYNNGDRAYERAMADALALRKDLVATLSSVPGLAYGISGAFVDAHHHLWLGGFGTTLRVSKAAI